jgi:hydrogenase expression/formation protein HypE
MTQESKQIVLAHGGGGELTAAMLREHVLPHLQNRWLAELGDGAVLGRIDGPVVFTTDSFVVQPLEFPGGDIGRLAVAGTVNDLLMMGATPVALSLGLILEEGLDFSVLDRVIASIARTAEEAGVVVATGDTKVIERRGGDGLMINTSGIGRLRDGVDLSLRRVRPGDAVLVSGNLGDHGLSIMVRREGLNFQTTLISDVAPLNGLVDAVLTSGGNVRFLRDPTRSGLAGVLADICEGTKLSVEIDEKELPVSATARHAAEVLGLDPLTVANEGKVVIVTRGEDAARVLDACRLHPLGKRAAIIGQVTDRQPPLVELITTIGGRRIVQRPYGEELPRIC